MISSVVQAIHPMFGGVSDDGSSGRISSDVLVKREPAWLADASCSRKGISWTPMEKRGRKRARDSWERVRLEASDRGVEESTERW